MHPSEAAGDEPAISVSGLVKSFGKVRALDGIDLAVPKGTVLGVLGPNGAGKTTTVRILATLLKPDAGSARVAGLDVVRDAGALRAQIGLAGQYAAVDEHLTGEENLVMVGRLYRMNRKAATTRAGELLERFNLADAADRVARTYSGGMQRKLDVAMGLIHRPRVLFLDEPTTGLDPEARADLWAEIERLTRADELTILLTTHYLEEADRLASRLAIVDHGRVVATGSPDELKAELRGDAIVVELADGPDERAVSVLTRVPGIGESLVDGRSLRARVDRGASAVPAVLSALEGAGIGVASVTVSRPSLDDVYLRHTGRSFRHTEESFA